MILPVSSTHQLSRGHMHFISHLPTFNTQPQQQHSPQVSIHLVYNVHLWYMICLMSFDKHNCHLLLFKNAKTFNFDSTSIIFFNLSHIFSILFSQLMFEASFKIISSSVIIILFYICILSLAVKWIITNIKRSPFQEDSHKLSSTI